MTRYYVDSCIWLNLLNKEQTKVQGMPVWKIAELFLEQYKGNIIVSDIVLRETINKTNNPKCLGIVDKYSEIINIAQEEKDLGREIESTEQYALSFFDCIHIAVCKTRKYTLITRDKGILEKGKAYTIVMKPEDIIY